jgi:hypothetical protein
MRYPNGWRLAALAALAGLVAVGTCGCHWLYAWAVAERHPMQEVKAEYELAADRLVIVPYASTEILFSDATASLEISRDLINEILQNVGAGRVKTIVHPVEVARWQEANLEWPNMPLADIGKVFQADTVLYVELEHYTMYEERSSNLFRGRVRARIQVARPDAEHNPVYETTVETVFPEEGPVGVVGTTERMVRAGTNLIFARDVARKFYSHKVEIRGGEK